MHLRTALSAALLTLLAACATPESLRPGMSVDEVRTALGRPTADLALPDGRRLQYSGQPYLQSVWNADFDRDGRLRGVTQMMTDEAFLRLQAGRDTQADVLRDYGPPADAFEYRLQNETAFMYRYLTWGGFKAAMFVYFDRAGVVKRTETGLDPWAIQGSGRDD